MTNPYVPRWQEINDDPQEEALAALEAYHAERKPVVECGSCGSQAYYRPGVGAYQCPDCRAVRVWNNDKYEWR